MSRRIMIKLEEEEFYALKEYSRTQHRDTRGQAAFLIKRALLSLNTLRAITDEKEEKHDLSK